MIAQVSHHYRKLAEATDDVVFSTGLIAGIGGHPLQFPPAELPMPIPAFTIIHNAYSDLVDKAKGGDATAVAARNQYRKTTWLPAVDSYAPFVNLKSNGDPS